MERRHLVNVPANITTAADGVVCHGALMNTNAKQEDNDASKRTLPNSWNVRNIE